MQTLMAERNNQLPADRVMQFRLGVHMGDVMADEDEVFGDGVNIAVRLEAVATPGGVAVSERPTRRRANISSVPLVDAGTPPLQEYRGADQRLDLGPLRVGTRCPASLTTGRTCRRNIEPRS